MSYLDRLKAQFPENCPTEVLTKLTEAPFVSSVSTRVGQKKPVEALRDRGRRRSAGDRLRVHEQAAIAREVENLREAFEERAAILEYDAGLPRADAEREAARITAAYARNRGCLWASLRAALAGYPPPAVPGARQGRHGRCATPGRGQARRAQGQARAAPGNVRRAARGEGVSVESFRRRGP
jgi:hypothetical protein